MGARNWFTIPAKLVAATIFAIGTTLADAAVLIEDLALKVDIRGHPYALETMIVKSDAFRGRLPIALIAHGSPRDRADRPNYHARNLLPQARDFAHRGWLVVAFMRRGFGNSDGPFAEGFLCPAPDYAKALGTAAEDIEAVRHALASRADADRTRVLGIGVSAGSASLLAWAATRPEGLIGIVNIAGGTGAVLPGGRICDEDGLVATIGAFGKETRVPTLWLYAENDSLFGPALVRRMHDAYVRSGGVAKYVPFGPVGNDGHRLFNLYDGRVLVLDALDPFLRGLNLPTWDPQALAGVSRALDPPQRVTVEKYLRAPTEKVLTVSRDNRLAWFWSNAADLESARQKSREGCERAARQRCDIAAENFGRVPRP